MRSPIPCSLEVVPNGWSDGLGMIYIHIQLAESGGYPPLGLLGLESRSGYGGRSCSTYAQERCHVNFTMHWCSRPVTAISGRLCGRRIRQHFPPSMTPRLPFRNHRDFSCPATTTQALEHPTLGSRVRLQIVASKIVLAQRGAVWS